MKASELDREPISYSPVPAIYLVDLRDSNSVSMIVIVIQFR